MQLTNKYDGWDDPRSHLAKWNKVYEEVPKPEWVHLFCHTLDVIPMNWYTKTELFHGTSEWDNLDEGFLLTFTFEDCWCDTVDDVLQAVKVSIFLNTPEANGSASVGMGNPAKLRIGVLQCKY